MLLARARSEARLLPVSGSGSDGGTSELPDVELVNLARLYPAE